MKYYPYNDYMKNILCTYKISYKTYMDYVHYALSNNCAYFGMEMRGDFEDHYRDLLKILPENRYI